MFNTDTIKQKVLAELQADAEFRRKFIVILISDELIKQYLKEEISK